LTFVKLKGEFNRGAVREWQKGKEGKKKGKEKRKGKKNVGGGKKKRIWAQNYLHRITVPHLGCSGPELKPIC